jgi:hypothetical protein
VRVGTVKHDLTDPADLSIVLIAHQAMMTGGPATQPRDLGLPPPGGCWLGE